MLSFKITTVGASSGIILTKEAMARLRVQKSDTLYLTESPDGGFRLTPYDPEFSAKWGSPKKSCMMTVKCCGRLRSDPCKLL